MKGGRGEGSCVQIFHYYFSTHSIYVKWHDIDINGYHVITFSHGVTVNLSTLCVQIVMQ